MQPAMTHLDTRQVQQVLEREHDRAGSDGEKLASRREAIDAAKADGSFTYAMYPDDVYLAIEPAMGRFIYLAALGIGARRIVEFGTSFGISTIYLAAAAMARDGVVIGSELIEEKADRARSNLSEAGLGKHAEVRVGDAMETLKDVEGPIDLLFLDGWKDLYLPVLEMLRPKLRPGALVLADNVATFPEQLEPYVKAINDPEGPFRSTIVPFSSGLAYSVYLGE